MIEQDDYEFEEGDPSVPSVLLELHIELELANISPEEFKEVFGNDPGNS